MNDVATRRPVRRPATASGKQPAPVLVVFGITGDLAAARASLDVVGAVALGSQCARAVREAGHRQPRLASRHEVTVGRARCSRRTPSVMTRPVVQFSRSLQVWRVSVRGG